MKGSHGDDRSGASKSNIRPDRARIDRVGRPLSNRREVRSAWRLMAERQFPDQELASYRWTVLLLWNMCGSTGYMMMSTLGILLPAITSTLSLSPSEQGLLGSSAFWGSLVLGIPMGWWASRFKVKVLTTATLVFGSLFLFAQGWAPVFAVLIGARLAFGITRLAAEPARALLVQQWFPQREIVAANSISNAVWGVAVGSGFLVTPFILSGIGTTGG